MISFILANINKQPLVPTLIHDNDLRNFIIGVGLMGSLFILYKVLNSYAKL